MLISIQYSIRLLHFPCIFTLQFVHLNSVPVPEEVGIDSRLWLPNYNVYEPQNDVEEKKWSKNYCCCTDHFSMMRTRQNGAFFSFISAINVWRSMKNKLCRFADRTSVKEIHSIAMHEKQMTTAKGKKRKKKIIIDWRWKLNLNKKLFLNFLFAT